MGKLIDIDYIIKGYALSEKAAGFKTTSMLKSDIYKALVDAPEISIGDRTAWHIRTNGELQAPPKNGDYLISIDDPDSGEIVTISAYYNGSYFSGNYSDYDIEDLEDGIYAWAEMPRPYKTKGKE